jgi:ABC-2 type transport system permease protein
MLRQTLLIAKREYLERVKSKVFRITTLLVPIGMGALGWLGGMSGHRLEGVQSLAIVSGQADLAAQVRMALEEGQFPPSTIQVYAPATSADRAKVDQEVTSHQIPGYLTL